MLGSSVVDTDERQAEMGRIGGGLSAIFRATRLVEEGQRPNKIGIAHTLVARHLRTLSETKPLLTPTIRDRSGFAALRYHVARRGSNDGDAQL